MSEALVPVTDWAFDGLRFEVLVFENARGNRASARLKEKFGASLVRVQPGSYVDPAYTESEIWELPKQIWELPKQIWRDRRERLAQSARLER